VAEEYSGFRWLKEYSGFGWYQEDALAEIYHRSFCLPGFFLPCWERVQGHQTASELESSSMYIIIHSIVRTP